MARSRSVVVPRTGDPSVLTVDTVEVGEPGPGQLLVRLAAAGVSASGAVVKAWTEKGGSVVATSKPVPIKQMLASPQLTPAQAPQAGWRR